MTPGTGPAVTDKPWRSLGIFQPAIISTPIDLSCALLEFQPTRVPQTQGKVADRPIEDTDPV